MRKLTALACRLMRQPGIFDIAFAQFNLGHDYHSAAILCQDAQKRIDTAAQNGFKCAQSAKRRKQAQIPASSLHVTGG